MLNDYSYQFHPCEIAFCGYSGSGKTTLISRLTEKMSNKYKVGYVKHDAHRFEMDHKGKDTWSLQESGAHTVLINDANHWATISKTSLNEDGRKALFTEMDFVFIEGYKNSSIPKMILVDEKESILEALHSSLFDNVLAFVGIPNEYPTLPEDTHYFQRDDIERIHDYISQHFMARKK